MALDDRDPVKEVSRYRRSEQEKQRRLESVRKRFEAATPVREKKEWEIEIPMPETTAGFFAVVAVAGLAFAAVVWVVLRIA